MRFGREICGCWVKNRISSAYAAYLCILGPTVIPLMLLCLICARKGSREMANNRGDRGHPCLVPLCRGM